MRNFIKRCTGFLFGLCCMCHLLILPMPSCADVDARMVSKCAELATALYEREPYIQMQADLADTMLQEVLCAYPLLAYSFEGYEGSIRNDVITMVMDYRDDPLLPVQYVDSEETFVEVVTQAAVASTEEIHITMPNTMSNADFGSLINSVFTHSVLARTMLDSFRWEIWTNSYTDVSYMFLNIAYSVEREQLICYKQLAEQEAIRLASSLFFEDADDVVIALLAHDGLVRCCSYSQEGNHEENHSVYGALCNHAAVCEGYAEAYQLLMSIAGLDCRYVEGEAGEPHAWNLLYIDGSYYHVDTTWDDPVSDDGVSRLKHDYFLLSDAEIAQTHTWEYAAYPAADAAFWDALSAKEQLAKNSGEHWFTVKYIPQCDDAALQAYTQQMAELLQQQKPPATVAQTATESETTQHSTGLQQDTSASDTEQLTASSDPQTDSATEKTTSAATTTTTTAVQHQGVSKGALYLIWGVLITLVLGILYAKFIY